LSLQDLLSPEQEIFGETIPAVQPTPAPVSEDRMFTLLLAELEQARVQSGAP